MARVAVKMLSFTFIFIVLHVLAQLAIICSGVIAIAEDNSMHGIACDDAFQLFKYCSFNGGGYFISLVTYFILKTEELARCRAAALAVLHSACATWGISTWYGGLENSACKTVFRDQYNSVWLYWNTLIYINCFYGLIYILHELVWVRCSSVDLTVVCEAQSAADDKAAQAKQAAAKTYNWSAPLDATGTEKSAGGYPGQPKDSNVLETVAENAPLIRQLPPELGDLLQAEYQKVVAGVNPSTPFKAEVDSNGPDMSTADMRTADHV